jgi:hypothetical protein
MAEVSFSEKIRAGTMGVGVATWADSDHAGRGRVWNRPWI